MKIIKMWKVCWGDGNIPTTEPYVLDCRSFDIPETMVKMVESVATRSKNCVAITTCLLGGHKMIKAVEDIAFEKGIRILWWFGPSKYDIPEVNRNELRSYVKTIRRNQVLEGPGRL